MTTTKLARMSFDEKLKQAEPGDHFVVYSPGVGGWLRIKLTRVEWPYLWEERSALGYGPWHASHVHKLEKRSGEAFER
jgi:hypothetical protein